MFWFLVRLNNFPDVCYLIISYFVNLLLMSFASLFIVIFIFLKLKITAWLHSNLSLIPEHDLCIPVSRYLLMVVHAFSYSLSSVHLNQILHNISGKTSSVVAYHAVSYDCSNTYLSGVVFTAYLILAKFHNKFFTYLIIFNPFIFKLAL